jgi:hypothetical protein
VKCNNWHCLHVFTNIIIFYFSFDFKYVSKYPYLMVYGTNIYFCINVGTVVALS